MLTSDLTEDELNTFTVIERVTSVFSLLGCVFIIGTFITSKSFHKPINRLVFYASIGNMMTNVATIMARSYVGAPDSVGCQFQGFLIQMFMPADAFWTLAMAVNVYLTFYFKYDARQLRKMEIPYLAFCYGLPFIVAFSYIFIRTAENGRMYNNASLWCWVSQSWDIFRIATFYGPVWVVIVITFFIYIRAGREIYKKHKELKSLNYTSHYDPEPLPINDAFNTKTTEFSITVSNAAEPIDLAPLGAGHSQGIVTTSKHHSVPSPCSNAMQYSVSISAAAPSTPSTPGSMAAAAASTTATTTNSSNVASAANPISQHQQQQHQQQQHLPHSSSRRRATMDANNAAWSYTKCALLFFTAMLVTWIPSSANRLYSLVKTGEINLALEYMSAFVLPLQGFWNAVIYVVTSWKACKLLANDVGAFLSSSPSSRRQQRRRRQQQRAMDGANSSVTAAVAARKETEGAAAAAKKVALRTLGRRRSRDSETESTEELAVRNDDSSASVVV